MRSILNVVASMRRRKRQVIVCPKCGSTGIRRSGTVVGFLFPTRFLCQSCGYHGHFIVELEDDSRAKSSSEHE